MKKFLVIWLGQVISILGSGLTSFALGVWIFDQTGQATPFALTVLFGNLPRILLSPIAGSLADRWNRRWLMILADSGDALVTLGVVVLLMIGNLQVWQIYLISLFSAIFAAFQEPAYTASITMLVQKKDLARASGLVQMSQAIEMLAAPVLAGLLFVSIGLRGIILIDFATFFFAIGAVLFTPIPQPELSPEDEKEKASIWKDFVFGWRYLRARPGLLGLLTYFALVNFLLNFSAVLTGPLVLSYATASTLGLVQMASGGGMLAGSILMSTWGGPQRRIRGVIGFITLAAGGLLIAGAQPSALFPAAGLFLLLFCVPLASGPSQAIFQSKVAPGVQGRVFAMRTMISRSMMPLAFLLAGPLADYVFEPLMQPGGVLASSLAGAVLGTGAGRGIGLMFAASGIVLVAASALAYSSSRIRLVEDELPDVLLEEIDSEKTGDVRRTEGALAG
jgi:DHA3 family macrolide efflux protein-like MFS transporter